MPKCPACSKPSARPRWLLPFCSRPCWWAFERAKIPYIDAVDTPAPTWPTPLWSQPRRAPRIRASRRVANG